MKITNDYLTKAVATLSKIAAAAETHLTFRERYLVGCLTDAVDPKLKLFSVIRYAAIEKHGEENAEGVKGVPLKNAAAFNADIQPTLDEEVDLPQVKPLPFAILAKIPGITGADIGTVLRFFEEPTDAVLDALDKLPVPTNELPVAPPPVAPNGPHPVTQMSRRKKSNDTAPAAQTA